MHAAFVGSRGFTDGLVIEQAILHLFRKHGKDLRIVSGGARGADSIAEKIARDNHIPVTLFLPDWNTYGKSAGFRRNKEIVAHSDIVLAFFAPGPRSAGTSNTVAAAKIAGKPVHVYHEGVWS